MAHLTVLRDMEGAFACTSEDYRMEVENTVVDLEAHVCSKLQ